MQNEQKNIRIAFVGNPNCGKTTLFNGLTGSNIKVGNWPGVTVEKVEGIVSYEDSLLHLLDLPGVYSLDHDTTEELITKECLQSQQIDLIVNVVDATALDRHLYLTLQLLELRKPMIIVLNMMDLVHKRGIMLDTELLSEKLGKIAVLPVSAVKKSGFGELYDHMAKVGAAPSCVYQKIAVSYEQVRQITAVCWRKIPQNMSFTDQIDEILLHPFWGIPAFLGIIASVFWLTFAFGDRTQEYLQLMLGQLTEVLRNGLVLIGTSEWAVALLVDGVMAGVGVVLTFLPNLLILFLAMAVMEDSGYMARVAYIMEEIMNLAGLSGKAFIPLLLGFGCTVPAVMATRILDNQQERKRTILLLPFMSCSAKLPIYLLLSSLFFPEYAVSMVFLLYLFSFLAGMGLVCFFRVKPTNMIHQTLLIELPEYHLPNIFTVWVYVREKVMDYLLKAGSTIFAASIILWLVLHMNLNGLVSDVSHSFAAAIGAMLVPVLHPIGLGQWQIGVALISGLSAKEVVIASFSVLFGIGNLNTPEGLARFTEILNAMGIGALEGFSFMVFSLFYTPCIAALAMVKREVGSYRWMFGMAVIQMAIAWLASFICFQFGRLLLG